MSTKKGTALSYGTAYPFPRASDDEATLRAGLDRAISENLEAHLQANGDFDDVTPGELAGIRFNVPILPDSGPGAGLTTMSRVLSIIGELCREKNLVVVSCAYSCANLLDALERGEITQPNDGFSFLPIVSTRLAYLHPRNVESLATKDSDGDAAWVVASAGIVQEHLARSRPQAGGLDELMAALRA